MRTNLALEPTLNIPLDCFFHKTLSSLFARSNENNVVVRLLARGLGELVRGLPTGNPLRLLDVGGGPGIKTFRLCQHLRLKYGCRLAITNVDPSEHWCSEYLENARNRGLRRCIETIECQTWKEFVPQGRYHFVLASHSVYGLCDWGRVEDAWQTVAKLRSATAPAGRACIVLQSDQNAIYSLQERFLRTIHGGGEVAVCGSNIGEVLGKLGLKFTQGTSTGQTLKLDFLQDSELKLKDADTHVLSLMLLLEPDHFRDLPVPLTEAIIDHLRNLRVAVGESGSEKVHRVKIDDDFFWIDS